MRKLVLIGMSVGMLATQVKAQTLFTYGGEPVTKQEFLRVYQKNTIGNKKPDMSEQALREYLDLYSLFKMKVKEAEKQQIDTITAIQRELDNYRRQLAQNYLTDEEVTNRLVREAYDRMKEEVSAAHIIVSMPPTTMSKDTVAYYQKIDSIYNAITKKGADFAEMAKLYSDDRSNKDNGGKLGYITALQTVYPFENLIYNTPVGKVSKPFRTQFGYHIVKVLDKRPTKGQVKVAQIMVATPKSKGEEGVAAAKKRVDSILMQLKKGAAFENMVAQYSDDKYSKDNNGELAVFGVGRMDPEFEKAAFALKKPGDISEPVKTEYGFHIIKLIEHYPLKPYDSLYPVIKKKVENDARAGVAKEVFYNKIKEANDFKEYRDNMEELAKKMAATISDTGRNAGTFKVSDYAQMSKPVFEFAGKKYTQSDFVTYIDMLTRGRMSGPKEAIVRDLYRMYVERVLMDYEEHRLQDENEDFKNLMAEYRAGIMLFELMDRNVWGKAAKDTTGLKAFYEAHKDKYMWEPGFTATVYRFKNEDAMKKGMKLLNGKQTNHEEFMRAMNTEDNADAVSIQDTRYEFKNFDDAPRSAVAAGKTLEPKKGEDGYYTVIKVNEVYNNPTNKSLEEARGYVVADYQDFLEKDWNAAMRSKYPVKVEDKVFTSMVKK